MQKGGVCKVPGPDRGHHCHLPSVSKAIKDRSKWTSAESCCGSATCMRRDSTLSGLSL